MAQSYPKGVENTVGKGEIACYEQFLLFPQCFQKACFPGASKGVTEWEWVNVTLVILQKISHNVPKEWLMHLNNGLYQQRHQTIIDQ